MSDRIPCPRCGYDVRGIVASWHDRCPLRGRCTECGLDLDWSRVVVPEKYEPRWCVEFAPRPGQVPMSCVRTSLRSLRPWRFWSRLEMAYRVRHRRLVLYACFLLLPVLTLYVAVQATAALAMRIDLEQQGARLQASVTTTIASMQGELAASAGEDATADTRLARKRAFYPGRIAILQARLQNAPTIDHGYVEAMVEAVVLPLAGASRGRYVDANGNTAAAYPPPTAIWDYVGNQIGGRLQREGIALARAGGACAALTLFPITFILLPVSRKRAKVRWAHIWRVFVYSLLMPVLIVWLVAVLVGAGLWLGAVREAAVATARLVASTGVWIALVVWWATAIGRYLRMPHAWVISTLMALMLSLLLSDVLLQVLELLGW